VQRPVVGPAWGAGNRARFCNQPPPACDEARVTKAIFTGGCVELNVSEMHDAGVQAEKSVEVEERRCEIVAVGEVSVGLNVSFVFMPQCKWIDTTHITGMPPNRISMRREL